MPFEPTAAHSVRAPFTISRTPYRFAHLLPLARTGATTQNGCDEPNCTGAAGAAHRKGCMGIRMRAKSGSNAEYRNALNADDRIGTFHFVPDVRREKCVYRPVKWRQ
ncbi:hypothetical protein NBRGN_016_00480 [Nocardia brasiliensis NBRC 14402]|nr:hypothetical protein NBRGN_016_00480 [Nocardia brasiliensis NBRC 14402]